MAVELRHDGPAKFATAGLDLNVPVDLVQPTKYSRIQNVISKIEGQLQARDGTTSADTFASEIKTIFRLNQYNTSAVSERLIGTADGILYAGAAPAYSYTGIGANFDGGPLSIIPYRFAADPNTWAIIANANGMFKYRGGLYELLGIAAPTVAATASAGGVGLLIGDYNWRYTYLNPVTQSESNGSPVYDVELKRPTANTNVGFTNPTYAYDGNFATAATGGGTGSTQSLIVKTWASTTNAYSKLTLNINFAITAAGVPLSNSSLQISYSINAGATWTTAFQSSHTVAQNTISIQLPAGISLSVIQVKMVVSGATTAPAVSWYEVWTVGTITPPTPTNVTLSSQSANVCVVAPTDPQCTSIRLYRMGGTLLNNWYQVGEYLVSSLSVGGCGAGFLQINDNVPDSVVELGPPVPLDNFQPVQSIQASNVYLPVIFGPYQGYVLGCGDPSRPDSVYFSSNGNADIWPAENWIVTANPGEQMMNGIIYALRCFAFSRERMYLLLPNIIAGVTFTPAETSCRRGLKGQWALCAGERGVYFVAKDGVYRTQGGPEESIIDDSIRPLFPVLDAPTGTPTNGYDSINMDDESNLRLVYHNGEVWFFYTGATTGIRQLLIYDERRGRWRGSTYNLVPSMAYSEPEVDSSLLLGTVPGYLESIGPATDYNAADIACEVTTGAFDQGIPLNLKEYVNLIVDLDPGGATVGKPVSITPRINGALISEATVHVTGSGRQRVAIPLNQAGVEVYGYNLEYDIQWLANSLIQPILYQYETLYRVEPTEQTHWELQPTTFGMQGWFHLRDIYVTMRSTQPVTLKVLDSQGNTQSFTLPSTVGAKQKLFVQLGANKTKTISFVMDSSAVFRTYADETEVRVKQWLTKLGYQNVPVLGREQIGKPFGLANI